MPLRNKRRLLGVLALVLLAGSLSACGCGPLGLNWCGGYGGPGGGPGWGGHHGGPPGGPGGPGPGGPGGWR